MATTTKNSANDLSKLSKPEKRVAIARDVLARLTRGPKEKRLKASAGTGYVRGRVSLLPGSLQPQVNKIQERCKVCALGGMFLSHVRLFNEVCREDISYSGGIARAQLDEVESPLSKYFSHPQLHQIEAAFEGWGDDESKGGKWVAEYPTAPDRLRAICENIIRNNGTFKIGQVTPPEEKKDEAGKGRAK